MDRINLYEVLDYIQPTKYIVHSEKYSDDFSTPVLTAGKTFILGYTDEKDNILKGSEEPVIIFDDFTSSSQYVDFDFKVKSSAMKILVKKNKKDNLKYLFYAISSMQYKPFNHKRIWISDFSQKSIAYREQSEQNKIVQQLDSLKKAIDIKKKQLNLLTELESSKFKEISKIDGEQNCEIVTLNDVCSSIVRGPFGSALKKSFFVPRADSTYKVYEQKHAIQKKADIGTYYITQEKFNELKRFECKPGDFIMSCSGTMGELFQLPENCEKGLINQALCKFTLNDKITSSYFLVYMRNMIDELDSHGTGIKNLSGVKFLKKLPIKLPLLDKQKDFEKDMINISKAKEILSNQIGELSELFDSRLYYYFN